MEVNLPGGFIIVVNEIDSNLFLDIFQDSRPKMLPLHNRTQFQTNTYYNQEDFSHIQTINVFVLFTHKYLHNIGVISIIRRPSNYQHEFP